MIFDSKAFKTTLDFLRVIFNLTKDELLENEQDYIEFRKRLNPKSIEHAKIDLLRILCNILHINKKAGDFILDNNYLTLCLSFTKLDENNTFQKEWTIVLIRNLTNGNERARDMIAGLTMMDMTETSK